MHAVSYRRTMMLKLTDIQTILLSTASQRRSGNVLPLSRVLEAGGARITKALTAFICMGPDQGARDQRSCLRHLGG